MTGRLVKHKAELALIDTMPTDQQIAESIKYGNVGVWLVPLPSGNWGVFGGSYRLVGTTEGGLPTEAELLAIAREQAKKIREETPKTHGTGDFEPDLGLVGSVASPDDIGL